VSEGGREMERWRAEGMKGKGEGEEGMERGREK
jgi:hypothetical protein